MRKQFVLTVVLLLGWGAIRCEAADNAAEKPQVTVQGQGKLKAVPDQARVWVEVSEQGPKLEDATQQVRRKIAAVLKAIKDQSIAEKDIQTQAYQVSPQFDWTGGRQL